MNKDDLWKEAKKRCRLNEETILMAKKLGLNPRSLIKNIPNKSEPWKAPVKDWIISMYEKSFSKTKSNQVNKTNIDNKVNKDLNDTNKNENSIFIITGPCGIGKSTISRHLATKFAKSAHVEADNLYNMIVNGYSEPWKDNNSLDILYRNIGLITYNFKSNNIIPIIDYIVFPDSINKILYKKDNFKYVVLMASKQLIIDQDLSREKDKIMGNRVNELYNEFLEKNIDSKYILNIDGKSIDSITEEILNDIRFNFGR